MDIKDVLSPKEQRPIIKSLRVSKKTDKFIRENRINLGKFVDISIKELKEKLKKETKKWS